MNIVFKDQVVFKNGEGKAPLTESDFSQELVDMVVKAFNENKYEALAPFSSDRMDVFDKIGETNYLGIHLENPNGELYQRFANSFTSLYSWFAKNIKEGNVILEFQSDGSLKAKDPTLNLYLDVGD